MASSLATLTGRLSDAVDGYGKQSSPSDAQRKQILALANQIVAEVSNPLEKIDDYLANMMEMAALRLLMDWDVFDKIPREPESISYAALSAKVDTEERLLKRMAWMLVSRGLLRQVGEDRVTHTKLSPIFAERESYALWFKFCYDNRGFVASRWPKYFARYGRKEPVNTTHDNPVSFAHGKDDKSFWDIIDGESLQDFITSMTVLSKICPNVGIFPFRWIVENMDMVLPDAAIVVDVGGSYGEALQDIREECPEIAPDRMVLQDRPPVIEKVERQDPPGLKGMKKMSHDFFTEQPVKGALVYFLRKVLHDCSDKDCRTILGHIKDAMASESCVLIYETIVSNPPPFKTAVADLAMMNMGAMERTEKDWDQLLKSAGLQIVKIWRTERSGEHAVIECKKLEE